MVGRRPRMRTGRGGRGKPKTAVGLALQDYFQPAFHTTDFTGLASGADIATTLVDNSADFSNSILKWSKLVIRPIWDSDDMRSGRIDMRTIMVMLMKRDEDDSTVPNIDSQETVRELRNDGRIVRGPWWVSLPEISVEGYVPMMAGHWKAIVLKNLMMDREEDLVITFTNVSLAFAAAAQQLDYALKGFVRAIK